MKNVLFQFLTNANQSTSRKEIEHLVIQVFQGSKADGSAFWYRLNTQSRKET